MSNTEQIFPPNPNLLFEEILHSQTGWITKNTAILVVHGIGFQLPLETLDQFGRGLIKQYRVAFEDTLRLKHEIVSKPDGDKTWFDNVLRISKTDSPYYIDIYEYYWANYTENKATWNDLNKWLQGVVKGAKSFYNRNGQLGQLYKDKSPFFDKRTGEFITWKYRVFLSAISQLFFIIDQLVKATIWVVSHIPFVGKFAGQILESYTDSAIQNLTNLLVDLVAYNVVDPKSKFYCIRSEILDGSVKALQYLIERVKDDENKTEGTIEELTEGLDEDIKNSYLEKLQLVYPSVVVAGHSLGTQISYDTINRINLMVNKNKISNYNSNGTCKVGAKNTPEKQLNGFITFGSPLDKVLFFLRENIPDTSFLRQQFLNDYHGFKQHDIDGVFNNTTTNAMFVKADCGLQKFFEETLWRNYYDDHDYVSGGLDYYTNLTNINCQFKAGKFGFTHSYYWDSDKFFLDVITNFLS